MKKILIAILFIFSFTAIQAQEKAVTDKGEEVVLFKNGTWKYVNKVDHKKSDVYYNPVKFKKDKEASFALKSNVVNMSFYLDPKKWAFKKSGSTEESEYDISLKSGDLYAMIITEQIEIPIDALKTIAFENALSLAPDLEIVKEEYRIVNDLKILHLQMNGTIKGIKFSYYGYYYSDENGTTQFVTYTSQKLLEKYKSEAEKLLNGIMLNK